MRGLPKESWSRTGVNTFTWGALTIRRCLIGAYSHISCSLVRRYYTDAERAIGYKKKDFIQAKYDFIDQMAAFGKIGTPKTVLDVGCGIGGE